MTALDEKIPAHERLRVGALLTFVGGFLEAYTFLLHGGVFANAQTGNIVLMVIALAQRQWGRAFYYLIPIGAFLAGVLLTEYLKKRFTDSQYLRWERIVVLLECVVLLGVGFLPEHFPDAVTNIAVSFLCSMQFNTFRRLGSGMPYASAFCTGNLRSAAENLFHLISARDREAGRRALKYAVIILSFCIGIFVSAITAGLWQNRAVWICCAVLLAAEGLTLLKK